MLSRTFREALIGDRLLTAEPEAFSENFYPRAPDGEINGRIIAVTDGVAQIGEGGVLVVIDAHQHGDAAGLQRAVQGVCGRLCRREAAVAEVAALLDRGAGEQEEPHAGVTPR